jgi:hypothetical protein
LLGGKRQPDRRHGKTPSQQQPPLNHYQLTIQLKQQGIHEDTIQELLAHYPQERIAQQLSYLPYRNATNPAGLLVKAIKADWSPPTGYPQTTDDQQTKTQAAKPTPAFNPAQEALARLKAEAQAEQNISQKLSAIASKLSSKRKQTLLKEAEARIRKRLKNAWPKEKPIPRTFLLAEFHCLLTEKYLNYPKRKKSESESTHRCPDDTD